MTQVGLNAGARDCRVIDLGVSFSRKLSLDKKTSHDERAVGAACLVWGLSKALLPTAVTQQQESAMKAANVPRLATRQIDPGA